MAGIVLTSEQSERIMSIHDHLMGSLRDSLAAHEAAKTALGERDARIAQLESDNRALASEKAALMGLAANAVDPDQVKDLLDRIDGASADIRAILAPPHDGSDLALAPTPPSA